MTHSKIGDKVTLRHKATISGISEHGEVEFHFDSAPEYFTNVYVERDIGESFVRQGRTYVVEGKSATHYIAKDEHDCIALLEIKDLSQ